MELFVPGRACLFGEHSDWAGGFRRFNKELSKGSTIVVGTNQGIYARVKKHPSKLILTTTNLNGEKKHTEISMDSQTLLQEAQAGGHWSYIAGVAYKIHEQKLVGGLEIDNYMTTLPPGKGLSSSAAICVLTARAFNRLYDLRLTTTGEMEYAYQGELVTPSQCGRLDQACAFGSAAVLMSFDGELARSKKIAIKPELHMLLVDLCSQKDTTSILQGLQSAYPHGTKKSHHDLHHLLGKMNQKLIQDAMELLSGNAALDHEKTLAALGQLMNKAQQNFDRFATPLCPSQLKAPILHRCLEYPGIQPYIYGGKLMGSGGDGTVQLLCKDLEAQRTAARIIEEDLKMKPLLLSIAPSRKINIAVIPCAGFFGNLYPSSHACRTEILPILDPKDGLFKPLILHTVEQVLAAGVERVVLVVQPDDLAQFQRLFQGPLSKSNLGELPEKQLTYSKHLNDVGRHIEFVIQEEQLGFGHAVLCTRQVVGENPFLVVLGHHLYLSDSEQFSESQSSCVEQILAAHDRLASSVISLKHTKISQVERFGTVAGVLSDDKRMVDITQIFEKPSQAFAKSNLFTKDLPEDTFLTMFGMYALEPTIFNVLERLQDENPDSGNLDLTNALSMLNGLKGLVINGERLAINSADAFVQTSQRLLEVSQREGVKI